MQDGYIKNCRVFIASPSDVQAERKIVRKVCENLNKDPLVREKQIILDPAGWEDVVPSAGRPQDTINLLAKNCDIFVCILHKKYGTPTGISGSGTEEEFLNAYEDWKNTEKPKILFYFKKAEVSSMADLKDPQLQKVLELKEKIQKDEALLYGNFAKPEDFETILSDHFKKLIPDLVPKPARRTQKTATKAEAVVPAAYRKWLNDTTKCMDIDCLRHDGSVINVTLPEIFQPLFSDDPDKKIKKGKKKDRGEGLEKENKPVEIEKLAGKGRTLLVIGTAGSGKTTLAKHMARTIINAKNPFFEKDLLPVLIYFKDLKGYPYQGKAPGAESAKDILGWYCKNFLSAHVDLETILLFCKEGKCIFLLDGLDEAEPGVRHFAASSFADFRQGHDSVKIVLLGRPHGTDGKVADRFGDRLARVHDLTNEQAEAFISNWFSHVHGDGSFTGKELSDRMRGDIRARNDIDDLKKNPLLLTAMCILYTDLKELPNQRADLYNRYVERLFSKFGEERIRVNKFMMEMAHSMFEQGDRGLDHVKGIAFLKKHFTLMDGNSTFEALFDRIEPATGLLHRENGCYKFIHLTFQEFLTAKYFVDQTKDSFFDTISPCIEKKRYAEVVKLFIGFLSIRNSGAANAIIGKILGQEPLIPGFYNHILAAEALMDIHKDNREKEVEDLAMDRMLTLIRTGEKPPVRLQAGEVMGRLGYEKELDDFVPIKGGTYDLEDLGKKEIKDFEISKFPVTNLWYGRFIKDRGYETPDFWTKEGLKWLEQNKVTEPLYWRERRFNCPTSPVVGVSWYEAAAFCRWLEAKDSNGFSYYLSTAKEWQAAAAGKEKREYPWGGKIDIQKCNYNKAELGRPSPVGIFLEGKTPEGVHDLAGNVWEWTRTDYSENKDYDDFSYDPKSENNIFPALRGGSFGDDGGDCRCADRSLDDPGGRGLDVGFRCARIKL